MPDHDIADEDELEDEEIEAYCVSCRDKVPMENPQAVWTRRGRPGTRGTCPVCGSTVFRMGRTEAHRSGARPDLRPMREIAQSVRGHAPVIPYLNAASGERELARRIADDLQKMGITTWLAADAPTGEVQWASGAHPALVDCSHMIVVLSEEALASDRMREGWQYFRDERKPVIVALAEPVDVPDALRRVPRFDFTGEFRTAFREMLNALTS